MASPPPASWEGTRILFGCLSLLVLGCTGPNPAYLVASRTDGGVVAGGGGGRLAPGTFGGQGGGGGSHVGGITGSGGQPAAGGNDGGAAGGMAGNPVPPGSDGAADGGTKTDVGSASDTMFPVDSTPRVDTPGSPDGSVDMGIPPVQSGQGSEMCGQLHTDLTGVMGARGIAIDAAGTIYFTRESGTQAWIGRIVPGMAAQPSLWPLTNNTQPRMLRVDSMRNMLFITGIGTGFAYAASTVNPAAGLVNFTSGLPGAHGLAVAEDGAVFVSLDTGYVMRAIIDLSQNTRTMTTASPIFPSGQRPLGLAFGPDGRLYVGSSNGGIKRFRVQGTQLVEGTDYSQFNGSASDLAFDVQGRLYVADSTGNARRAVSVIPASGTGAITTLGATGLLSGLAFGRGSLDCTDLYVTDVSAVARRLTASGPGLRMP